MYAAVSVPSGSAVVVIVRPALIVIDNACVVLTPLASVSSTVKFEVPAVVGTPLITPVAESRLRPAGSVPSVIAQFNGAVPPVEPSVWL